MGPNGPHWSVCFSTYCSIFSFGRTTNRGTDGQMLVRVCHCLVSCVQELLLQPSQQPCAVAPLEWVPWVQRNPLIFIEMSLNPSIFGEIQWKFVLLALRVGTFLFSSRLRNPSIEKANGVTDVSLA